MGQKRRRREAAGGELLRLLLADAKRLAKMMRVERALEVQYDVEQYRKVLGTYVRGARMPRRRRPVVM